MKAIMDILQKAPDYIQKLFIDYAAQFRAGFDPLQSHAFYSPPRDAVFLRIDKVATGDGIHTKYQNIFHEYGHMLDSLIARDLGHTQFDAYSDLYKGGLLAKTAERELQTRIFSIMQSKPGMTRDQAADTIIVEVKGKYSKIGRADLSDIMEGAGIGKAYPLGAGHGLAYWTGPGAAKRKGMEIFAEITDAVATSPEGLRAIREYLPQTYGVYQEMIRGRVKK